MECMKIWLTDWAEHRLYHSIQPNHLPRRRGPTLFLHRLHLLCHAPPPPAPITVPPNPPISLRAREMGTTYQYRISSFPVAGVHYNVLPTRGKSNNPGNELELCDLWRCADYCLGVLYCWGKNGVFRTSGVCEIWEWLKSRKGKTT